MLKQENNTVTSKRIFNYLRLSQLVFIFLLSFVLSCSKSNHCETWEYYDECDEKIPHACDTGPLLIYGNHFQVYLCGSKLDGIVPGYTVVRTDDSQKKVTRHYVRKIN